MPHLRHFCLLLPNALALLGQTLPIARFNLGHAFPHLLQLSRQLVVLPLQRRVFLVLFILIGLEVVELGDFALVVLEVLGEVVDTVDSLECELDGVYLILLLHNTGQCCAEIAAYLIVSQFGLQL